MFRKSARTDEAGNTYNSYNLTVFDGSFLESFIDFYRRTFVLEMVFIAIVTMILAPNCKDVDSRSENQIKEDYRHKEKMFELEHKCDVPKP